MILGFSTKFPKGKGKLSGKLTLFPEKILESLHKIVDFYYHDYHGGELPLGFNDKTDELPEIKSVKPKKHTIRQDSKNRWKVGMDIDFFIGVRTKNMFRFAPKVKVKSIQKIKITYDEEICDAFCCEPCVFIDDKPLHLNDYQELAINDGFDGAPEFFEWFSEDFEGKLIHWTDLKYYG